MKESHLHVGAAPSRLPPDNREQSDQACTRWHNSWAQEHKDKAVLKDVITTTNLGFQVWLRDWVPDKGRSEHSRAKFLAKSGRQGEGCGEGARNVECCGGRGHQIRIQLKALFIFQWLMLFCIFLDPSPELPSNTDQDPESFQYGSRDPDLESYKYESGSRMHPGWHPAPHISSFSWKRARNTVENFDEEPDSTSKIKSDRILLLQLRNRTKTHLSHR